MALDTAIPFEAFLGDALASMAGDPVAQLTHDASRDRTFDVKANWALSDRFADTAAMRRVSYTTNFQPNWINNGDSLWYNWRDHNGCGFFVAYPKTKAKTAMFDHSKLASQLVQQ